MKTYKLLYIPTACYVCWELGSFLLSKYDWYYKDNNLFHLNYTETGTKEQLEDLLNCMLLYYKEDYPELNISSELFEIVEVDI